MRASSAATPVLASAAAVAVALALGWSHGFLDPIALALVTLATGATIVAIFTARTTTEAPAEPHPGRWPVGILGLGVTLSLAYDALAPPGYFVRLDGLSAFRPLLHFISVLVATYLWRRPSGMLERVRFPLLVAAAAALGATVIRASPRPHIDVWYFEQIGSMATLGGVNPYQVQYPNIYGPFTPNYAPAVLSADRSFVVGNPYLPLTLLLGTPTALLESDVRWVMLVLVVISACALRRLGRNSRTAELAAVLLLVQPRALFVLEQSWTEPIVLASFLLTLVAIDAWTRRTVAHVGDRADPAGWIATGIAGALALGSKQYAPLLLAPVFFTVPTRGRWLAALLAAGGAVLIIAPFALSDGPAFFHSVIALQLEQPFRADALSWPAAVARMGGPILPIWPAFVLAAATLSLGIRRAVSPERAILAAAGAWTMLVLFNKQAFCNYYWLAVGLLCAAVAACARDRGQQHAAGDRGVAAAKPPSVQG